MAASDNDVNISLNVGGEAAKKTDDTGMTVIDIVERDPTDMNSFLKVSFEEIFAEPHPTIYSFDPIWTCSFKTFRNTKMWCYRITTAIFAVPAALIWGIYFALLACCTIWCCRPCSRAFEIEMACFRGFYSAILNTFVRPCYEAVGYVFHNFRITMYNGGSPPVESKSQC